MSQEDLIPFNQLTEQEQKSLASKGGKASVEARREKSKLKRIIAAYLDTKDASGLDNETKIITALGDKAHKGDVNAIREMLDRLYDKPKSSQDITLDKPKDLQEWFNEVAGS